MKKILFIVLALALASPAYARMSLPFIGTVGVVSEEPPAGGISYLGKLDFDDSTDTATSEGSITIPENTNCITLHISSFGRDDNNPTYGAADKLNFDNDTGNDFTHVGTSYYNSSAAIHSVYVITSSDAGWPGTGSGKTIYYDYPASVSEGVTQTLVFWSGVDATDPTGDMENAANTSASNATSSLTGMASGDVGVGSAYDAGTAADADPSGLGQTAIREATYNSASLSIGYELDEDVLQINVAAGYLAPVFFVLNAGS